MTSLENAHERIDKMEEIVVAHSKQLQVLNEGLVENTLLTKRGIEVAQSTADNTAELVELFKSWKGGMKVVTWVGNSVKGIAIFLGAVVGAYMAIHNWWTGNH